MDELNVSMYNWAMAEILYSLISHHCADKAGTATQADDVTL